MKKTICAIMLLLVVLTSFTACGEESIEGMSCNVNINSNDYYDGKSTIALTVTCRNNDTDKTIKKLEFDLRFYDINGIMLYSRVCSADYYTIEPGETYTSAWFDESTYPNFVVPGQVTRVIAVPKSVTVVGSGEDAQIGSGSDSGNGEESSFGLNNIIGIAISVAAIIVGCVLFYNAYFYDGTYIGGSWMKNYPDEKFKAALSYVLAIGGLIAAVVCIFI